MSRLVILSDLHLGRPHAAARGADALRPLWEGADHLVLNGDVAEVHHPHHRGEAARETLRLFDLCALDGTDLTVLSGNHDPFISDVRHLRLAGGQVFVTHGDVLHPAIAPWSPARARMREANRAALAALEPESRDELAARLGASQHAGFAEWADEAALEREALRSTFHGMLLRPWTLVQVLHYWRVFPALATRFVARHAPETRFVVLGHTHHPGVWHVGGRVVLNTGSFGFPGRPRAVVVEDRAISLVRIVRDHDHYRLDGTPLRRYELDPDVTARPPHHEPANRPGGRSAGR